MLFDKAQKIVEDYQIKNDIGNLDETLNQMIEEFDKLKEKKKEKKEKKEEVAL
ncbi:MAG TPA: hypothetical protein VI911_09640 [Patescibacteria group bacterium]|nr:hypothetical protein [Patescibacteria group bacterium]